MGGGEGAGVPGVVEDGLFLGLPGEGGGREGGREGGRGISE